MYPDADVEVAGTVNSTANTYIRIEIFASTANDATGYGEGQTYLGFVNVLTDGSGNASFSTTFSATVAANAPSGGRTRRGCLMRPASSKR